MKLVGMLRVKNEARWIKRVIESIEPVCASVFVFDDHSDDDTEKICASLPNVTFIPSPFIGVDEGRDKTFLLAEVMKHGADWILSIDGDEEVSPEVLPIIRDMIERPISSCYAAKILYLWDREDLIRVDGIYQNFWRPRLFKPSASNLQYVNLYGNMHCTCAPSDLDIKAIRYPGFELKHWGYIEKEIRIAKYQWYNQQDPNNANEDCYRHMVQGDIPEVPSDAKLLHAGPLRLKFYGNALAESAKSDRPTFSLCHPSARPHKWQEIRKAWMDAADKPEDIEYILCADQRWGFDESVHDGLDEVKITWNTRRKCFVDSVNTAADLASGEVLICIADDQYPCEHWDTLLKMRLPIHEYVEFVAEVNTGTPKEHERGIIVLPIVSRSRYERLGYVMFPGYESMYADNDLREHAVLDECLIDCRDLPVFPHRHPYFDKSLKLDAAYQHQNRNGAYQIGEAMFKLRRGYSFGDVNRKRGSLLLCLPGENFNRRWVQALIEAFPTLLQYFDVFLPPLMAYATNVYYTRAEIVKIIEAMCPVPDFILWIDDDNIVSLKDISNLFNAMIAHPELDAVAGWCLIPPRNESDEWRLSCGEFVGEEKALNIPFDAFMKYPDDVVPVHWSGFPVVLMKPSALLKAGKNPFCPVVSDKMVNGFMGEDISFWHHAHFRGGVSLAVDKRVRVPHLKVQDETGPVEPEKKEEAKETVAA